VKNHINKDLIQKISKNYYIIIGIVFLVLPILNLLVHLIPTDYSNFLFFIPFVCFTLKSDIRTGIDVKSFLFLALPFLAFIMIIFINGNGIWQSVLSWEIGRNLFNLNDLFSKIPLNDGSFARIFSPGWFTEYMKFVYNTGFVLAAIVPIVRSALAIDFKKMVRYTLSAHVFQVFLITPLYIAFFLQEVWFVKGHPDMLARVLTPDQTLSTVLNCFPSMHTSIAFAMFLLVLREKDNIFKWVWGIYCISVIYSTMYLEIHWVIDVIAGIIFGYAIVKLVDFVLKKSEAYFPKKILARLHKESDINLIGCND
jgi:membrane-associated phospholipid phosphatase